MRLPFTDGPNSFWHFTFGILATQSIWILLLYFIYQLYDPFETNVWVDCFEFVLAFCITFFTQGLLRSWGFVQTLLKRV